MGVFLVGKTGLDGIIISEIEGERERFESKNEKVSQEEGLGWA